MKKKCIICGKEFNGHKEQLTCGDVLCAVSHRHMKDKEETEQILENMKDYDDENV